MTKCFSQNECVVTSQKAQCIQTMTRKICSTFVLSSGEYTVHETVQ